MKTDGLHGLAVFSIAGGEKVGTVARTYLDGRAKRVAGFAVRSGSVFADDAEFKVDAAEIRSVGPDALMLDDKASIRGTETNETYGTLSTVEEVTGRPVLNVVGQTLGHVVSMTFDTQSYALTTLELSPGVFKSNRELLIADVIVIGRDFVIVNTIASGNGPAEIGEQA